MEVSLRPIGDWSMPQCSGILQMPAIQLFFQLSSNFIFAAFILQSDSWPTEFCFHQPYLPPTLLHERTRLCLSHWLSVRLKHILRPGKISSLNKETDGGAIISIFAPIIWTNYQITLMQPGSSVTFISFCSVLLLIFELQQRNESGPISPYSTFWDIAEGNLSQIRQDPAQGIILRI